MLGATNFSCEGLEVRRKIGRVVCTIVNTGLLHGIALDELLPSRCMRPRRLGGTRSSSSPAYSCRERSLRQVRFRWSPKAENLGEHGCIESVPTHPFQGDGTEALMVGILRGRPRVRRNGDVIAVIVLDFGVTILLGLGDTRRVGVQPEAAGDTVNHPLLAGRFERSKSHVGVDNFPGVVIDAWVCDEHVPRLLSPAGRSGCDSNHHDNPGPMPKHHLGCHDRGRG